MGFGGCSRALLEPSVRPPDDDVAGGRAGPDLDRLGRRLGLVGGVERVVHPAGGGADVEPRGGALADADLEVPERGFEHHRAARDVAQPDVPVGGLGDDAGVREVDRDVAVGGVDPQVAAGGPDPGVKRHPFHDVMP
jgi:hypothetical protein